MKRLLLSNVMKSMIMIDGRDANHEHPIPRVGNPQHSHKEDFIVRSEAFDVERCSHFKSPSARAIPCHSLLIPPK